jgi:hypothetical protein
MRFFDIFAAQQTPIISFTSKQPQIGELLPQFQTRDFIHYAKLHDH